jgi:hypothetical protein
MEKTKLKEMLIIGIAGAHRLFLHIELKERYVILSEYKSEPPG